jgi:hypothetical protein
LEAFLPTIREKMCLSSLQKLGRCKPEGREVQGHVCIAHHVLRRELGKEEAWAIKQLSLKDFVGHTQEFIYLFSAWMEFN